MERAAEGSPETKKLERGGAAHPATVPGEGPPTRSRAAGGTVPPLADPRQRGACRATGMPAPLVKVERQGVAGLLRPGGRAVSPSEAGAECGGPGRGRGG